MKTCYLANLINYQQTKASLALCLYCHFIHKKDKYQENIGKKLEHRATYTARFRLSITVGG